MPSETFPKVVGHYPNGLPAVAFSAAQVEPMRAALELSHAKAERLPVDIIETLRASLRVAIARARR